MTALELQLRELLESTDSGEKAAMSESGWVIELGASPASRPEYWCGGPLWSPDNLKAIRFSRKVDAEATAFMNCNGINIRIAEHQWD